MKLFVVLPAFNEEKSIGSVIKDLKRNNYRNIIVVDDGSVDKTSEIAKKEGVQVYKHLINRGLGGALGTGIKAAVQNGAEIVVTIDADGQHDISDIKKAIKPIQDGDADVVIGTRLADPKGMPIIRKIGNWGFNCITYLLFNIWTTDSQSGFRVFSKDAAKNIRIKTNRMEVSSEIINEIKRNRLRFTEVPIKVIYTDYSLQHGQSSLNAFKILVKLMFKKIMK
ncbi:hypothetical protein COV93_01815 [Candidatus Woesearchaeota archaeon CG11_big_fil_rev_8_21_14_0_20_43_8]|nr:MAG: hypothetical protein COV93_01815 [Candidatus Woesearchaeota archaeon CG11_big_fil_rev_8_21_14_0_20_43_8]PIO05556.1 MAG: glycosyltransferase family 2 protein [Candidatus Woesearchaeota archaeon CG08_land_8_20_14_0_20_43_7]